MPRRRVRRGVEPPVKSGHAVIKVVSKDGEVRRTPAIFWIKLSKEIVNEIHRNGAVRIPIVLPTGEEVIKRVTSDNLFQGNKIAIYRRSDGSWALRNFSRDRKIAAIHKPERIGDVIKGMTGDRPNKRKRHRKK
jgi:hypothetical protein